MAGDPSAAPIAASPIVRFVSVSKRYDHGGEALKDVSFALPRGQMAFLTGRSGAGKSTLLRLIALLDDEHWWVRYRAAEALSNLPWMTAQRLTTLYDTLNTVEGQLGPVRTALSVKVPIIRPTIFVALVFTVIGSLQ